VWTTTREASDRDFECRLAEGAAASYFPQFKSAAPEMIVAQGGGVDWTAPVKTILEAIN
jgi:nicotinamidase-related amidase